MFSFGAKKREQRAGAKQKEREGGMKFLGLRKNERGKVVISKND